MASAFRLAPLRARVLPATQAAEELRVRRLDVEIQLRRQSRERRSRARSYFGCGFISGFIFGSDADPYPACIRIHIQPTGRGRREMSGDGNYAEMVRWPCAYADKMLTCRACSSEISSEAFIPLSVISLRVHQHISTSAYRYINISAYQHRCESAHQRVRKRCRGEADAGTDEGARTQSAGGWRENGELVYDGCEKKHGEDRTGV